MEKNSRIRLRGLRIKDYISLRDSMVKAYPDLDNAIWGEEQIKTLLEIFPKGQLCVTVNGKVVAAALAIIVQYDLYGDDHTYKQITGNYTFNTHDNDGDVLYGIDVFVDPK